MAYLSSGKKKLLGSNTEDNGDTSLSFWQPNTEYKVNDLCLYKEENYYSVYICVTEHTSSEAFVSAYWEVVETTVKDTLVNAINEIKEELDEKAVVKKITWAEYQALSEAEKNNGTVYYILDMPVSTRGEVERLNGYLVSDVTLSVGDVIPFVADSNSNIEINNGLVTLKKGKTYSIFADLRLGFSDKDRFYFYGLKDDEGNTYGSRGYDSSNNRDVLYGAHTSIKYTLTPTKDIKICIYLISGGDTSISAYASTAKLTITEIPSLQACIDVTDEHIKEVASRGISDIPKTSLALIDSASTGNVFYKVINGVCYVWGSQFSRASATGEVNDVYLCDGLPNCGDISPNAPIQRFSQNKGFVWIAPNETKLKIATPDATGDWCLFCFSYPVAES